MNHKQHGFTLVEIAIVLVIIGLLLGGVFKGQELINSAKVKNLAGDFRSIPLLIYGYQDKFKQLPGDDNQVVAHLGATGTAATTPADHKLGNGLIEGDWNSTTMTDESILFWQHVRLAGLNTGSTDFTNETNAHLPTNAEGGRVGIQMTSPITGLNGSYFVCSTGLNNKLAQQLDTTIDDGVADQGSVRALNVTDKTVATKFEDGKTYTLCLGF